MKKVIAVIGPTGVGKTSLGVKLAKWLNTEIISGDSIQVYQGLDVGSAKVTEEEMEGIRHHLIDILPLEAHYSVYDFQQQGRAIIEELHQQNKIPLIVGGTGLYIKSLLYDYEFEPSSEEEMDTKKYESLSNEELYARLQEIDAISAEKIHPNNRKRILRALTIYETHGKKKSEMEEAQKHELIYDAYLIGLTCERSIIYNRINQRVDKMLQNGLLAEIDRLSKIPNVFDAQGMQGIGYKEFKDFVDGKNTLEETIEEIKKHSRQFAKRQYTWFNNQMDVHWYDISKADYQTKLLADLSAWMEDKK